MEPCPQQLSCTAFNSTLSTGKSKYLTGGLQAAASSMNWDRIAADPDPGLPDDWYVDWRAPDGERANRCSG